MELSYPTSAASNRNAVWRHYKASHIAQETDLFEEELFSSAELGPEQNSVRSGNVKDEAQALKDVEAEVAKLGYDTKFTSKWYHHVCRYDSCQARWSEFAVVDDEEVDLKQRTSAVPIIHRHDYVRKHWVTASITVQDPAMRKVLSEVLFKYQDLDLELENWTFQPPFMSLVHRWQALNEYPANAREPDLKNGASALLLFLTPILASSVASLTQSTKTAKVSFENAWQIYSPGILVITKFLGTETICRLQKYKKIHDEGKKRDGWLIDMEFVDWNGEETGLSTTQLTIWEFKGFKKVMSLPAFPISFLEKMEETKATMIQRGRKFESLRGYHFMISNGVKVLLETKQPEQRPIAGKVCVDAYAYYRSCNVIKPKLRPFPNEKEDISIETTTEDTEQADTSHDTNFSVISIEAVKAAKGPAERVQNLRPLSDEECLIATPWMKGFDLKAKQWCELRVDDLREMTWNDQAFEKLILPGGEKELAWEFVESKSLSTAGFDDFIPDKGRGLIILMFGPPGVGKTFTAEAVAERSRVPLYSMSAGDLGIEPALVEKALERALELCRMWNAMLLLDEADVFLGARTNESLARNELVSIFLTKLEYYQGILFLTTNRMSSIDHAFQSRVDMFLPYHDLVPEVRRKIWESFIEHAGRDKFEVDDDSLDELSKLDLNGREIKNLVKTAQLLSLKSGGHVPMDRLYMLARRRKEALAMLGDSAR